MEICNNSLPDFAEIVNQMVGYVPYEYVGLFSQCKIVRKGYSTRTRCYDLSGPFELRAPLFYCQIHCRSISVFESSDEIHTIPPLVVFPRTIFTKSMAQSVFDQAPLHYFNFSSLKESLIQNWKTAYMAKISQVSINVH
jgi:hypothetical protein